LKIISIDKTGEELQRNVFHYSSGIFKQLDEAIARLQYIQPLFKLNISSEIGKFSYNIGIFYFNGQSQNTCIKTYAGNTEMLFGGSLIDGILDGTITSFKMLADEKNVGITITKKSVTKQMMIVAQVTGEDIVYVGATKSRIGMPKMRKEVKKLVSDHLTSYSHKNPEMTQRLLNEFKPLDEITDNN
jgi:DNA gyrase/topoisomerase IV subunit B